MKLLALSVCLILLSACKPDQLTDIQNQQCSENYEQDLAEYEQGVEQGLIDPSQTTAPKQCNITPGGEGLIEEATADLRYTIKMTNFSEYQEKKMRESLIKLEVVINSEQFKQRVLDHVYNNQKQFRKNKGLSNEEIYNKLMLGAEDLLPEVDQEMDIDVTMYYKNNSTVGYTYPNTTRTWVNSKFFNRYTHAQVAKNIVHEWTHKLGFEHSFNSTSSRRYSVPYAIGSIIQDLMELI